MPFHIIRNDITRVRADAIVNTANPHPVIGSGTDRAVYDAAGAEQMLAERKKIGDIARGTAAATPAFGLNAKYVIHTVGPVWEGGEHGEEETLRSCYRSALELAVQLGCASAAFPLISSGVYGFPKDRALRIALDELQGFSLRHDMDVTLVVFDDEAAEMSRRVSENIRAYIDAHYVEAAHGKEYGTDRPRNRAGAERLREEAGNDAGRLRETPGKAGARTAFSWAGSRPEKKKDPAGDLKEKLASYGKSFREKLFEIMDERGLKPSRVYRGYISKQTYSKLLSAGPGYRPSKRTALLLCLALHLDLDQTQDMLARAGWSLDGHDRQDLAVASCIEQGLFELHYIDQCLSEQGIPMLGTYQ